MKSSRFVLFALPLACTIALPARAMQGKGALKRQVDGLVQAARAAKPNSPAEAAVTLVALTHCHRHYDMQDGPILRQPRAALFHGRRADGLFGEDKSARLTTAWAYQALHDLGPKEHAADLSAIRAAFAKRFHVTGLALDAALQPFAIGRALALPPGIRPVFARLIRTVHAQEQTAHKAAHPAPVRPFAPFQQKAIDWLLTKQNGKGMFLIPTPDGKKVPDPGLSALCLSALATKPAKLRSDQENAVLTHGIEFLLAAQKRTKDGSFSSYLPNYVTCAAVMALSRVKGIDVDKAAIQAALAGAQKYLLAIQNIEHTQYASSDRDYGSIGYGGDQRGDLSNTQMAIEALRQTGLDVQDEAFAKALVFLRRAQNLPGKAGFRGSRTTEDGKKVQVVPGDDGGAQYYPGNSPAGYDATADGKSIPRSYGSMTYALLKCYVLCGLPKSDPRLQAALNWCLSHYRLDVNPGAKPSLGEKAQYQGLYYYYLTLARALALAGVDEVQGKDWRKDLRAKLASEQTAAGFWVNAKNGRWWESMPQLCTAYALLALAE